MFRHEHHCISLVFLVVLVWPAWKPLFSSGCSGFSGFSKPMAAMAPLIHGCHRPWKTRKTWTAWEKQWFSWWSSHNYQKNQRNTMVFMLVEPRRGEKQQKTCCFQCPDKWEVWRTSRNQYRPFSWTPCQPFQSQCMLCWPCISRPWAPKGKHEYIPY